MQKEKSGSVGFDVGIGWAAAAGTRIRQTGLDLDVTTEGVSLASSVCRQTVGVVCTLNNFWLVQESSGWWLVPEALH